jgi:hypothetical protein
LADARTAKPSADGATGHRFGCRKGWDQTRRTHLEIKPGVHEAVLGVQVSNAANVLVVVALLWNTQVHLVHCVLVLAVAQLLSEWGLLAVAHKVRLPEVIAVQGYALVEMSTDAHMCAPG